MLKPKDLSDHSQCIDIGDDRVMAWCVECDYGEGAWRNVAMVGTALVSVSFKSFSYDLDRDSVALKCTWCYADLSYLFTDRRAEAIGKIADRGIPA